MSFLSSKRIKGKPRELQAGQLHLNSWESDRATNPGNGFQAHEEQGGQQEQSGWIHQGEVMLDQPDHLQ